VAFGETARQEPDPAPREIQTPETPPSDAPRLRVNALGALEVFVGDKVVDSAAWGSARPRELLVYLLMHPDGRTKEQVGLAFWPEASASQLRNNFHVALHRLRKALGGAEWITLAGERYRVNPERLDSFDVLDFERSVTELRKEISAEAPEGVAALEQLLTRFRGDFLYGEPAGEWHLEHRERVRRLYVDALLELAARAVREGRHVKAAEIYRRVLSRDKLHEEATLALMQTHAELGERGEALRVYDRYVARLREELGAKPGDAATRFGERLRQDVAV